MSTPPLHVSVAAPCFNERDVIPAVVAEWNEILDGLPRPSEIVLCNDGSSDGTGEVLEELGRRFPRLRVVSFDRNGGYGRALSAAIDATRGQFVVTLDSDGQFDLRDGLRLLELLQREKLDAVTGFRRKKRDRLIPVIADRGLNLLVRTMFGLSLRDTNCALKVVRGELLRGTRVEARGYPTPTEICVRLHALGARIGESGVDHRERQGGASKLHPFRTAWAMFRFLRYLRRKRSLYRARILLEP